MALELVEPKPPKGVNLYLSGLISVLPIAAHIIGQTSEGIAVLFSLTIMYTVSGLATLHLWFRRSENPGLPSVARVGWTIAVFIAPVFVAPLYWALHILLPSRKRSPDSGERFALLTKESNPLRAHMLKELLSSAGIPLRIHGTEDAAGVGMGQFIVAQRFEVPEAQLQDAKALLDSQSLEFPDTPELSGEGELFEGLDESVKGQTAESSDTEPSRGPMELAIWLILGLLALRLLNII